MKKLSILVSVIVVVAALAASAASANCIPAKLASNVQAITPFYYSYLYFGTTDADGSNFIGHFWQTDSRAAGNEGSLTPDYWMFNAYPGTGDLWYFYINTGYAQVSGCPTGLMTVYLEYPGQDNFIVWSKEEIPSGGFNYDYSMCGGSGADFVTAAPSPRPRIDGSGRSGTNVLLDLTVLDPTPGVCTLGPTGHEGNVTAIRVYAQSGTAAPSRLLPGGWGTAIASFGATGGSATAVPVDCSNEAVDQWVATELEISGVSAGFVGEPVQVECDPNIANPGRVFKRVDRPGPKPKTKR